MKTGEISLQNESMRQLPSVASSHKIYKYNFVSGKLAFRSLFVTIFFTILQVPNFFFFQ